jgi:hypothetical protein
MINLGEFDRKDGPQFLDPQARLAELLTNPHPRFSGAFSVHNVTYIRSMRLCGLKVGTCLESLRILGQHHVRRASELAFTRSWCDCSKYSTSTEYSTTRAARCALNRGFSAAHP